MAVGEKAQLYKDRAKTIPASYKTKAEYVILSDGNNLEEVLRDDLVASQVNHEEINFKVGQGDVDVSTSVVDGEASKMVIKGQTYQNILPEPSLRNSMTDGKSMQKFNEGYDDVNVVDGVAKSAILKGQTLVNSRGNTVSSGGWSTTDSIEYIVEGTNSFLNFECTLLPNTKYLTFFEFEGRGASIQFGTRPANGVWDSAHVVTTDGICKTVVTTGSDSKWLSFIVPNSSSVTDYVKISRIMIIPYQDGMENWDIPYFEGMTSVKMPVLTTTNADSTKTNILTTPEDLVMRSNGNVCDTLDLITGQFTQRIDENNEILSQEVIKTVDLSTVDQNGEEVTDGLHSFNDGCIQVSSEEGSLLPFVEYEVPTSNSYHMDLMKSSTQYTMKNMSGTFNLNGVSGNLSLNGTFTTLSDIDDKLMTVSTTQTNPMIIEGDLTSKTIPYFKGIKSAFENEDKIEVLSTGKNLFDRKLSEYDYIGNYDKNEVIIGDNFIEWNASNSYKGAAYYHFYVKPNTSYTLSLERNIMQRNCITIYDGFVTSNMDSISNMEANKNNTSFVTLSNKITIRFSNGTILNETFKIYNVQLEEGDTVTTYEPYKSNSTKIPLLHPLRSLPNGVCDEVIIDRMNNKAKIIQRVGYVKYNNLNRNDFGADKGANYVYISDWENAMPNRKPSVKCSTLTSHFPHYLDGEINKKDRGDFTAASRQVLCWCLPSKFDTEDRMTHLKFLAKRDGLEVQYELEKPIITEVDLSGHPHIYKDGHIFLNTEIAPKVELTYNTCQSHQIQANNESLQRHEKEISELDEYIAYFIESDYRLKLLKFDMEMTSIMREETK